MLTLLSVSLATMIAFNISGFAWFFPPFIVINVVFWTQIKLFHKQVFGSGKIFRTPSCWLLRGPMYANNIHYKGSRNGFSVEPTGVMCIYSCDSDTVPVPSSPIYQGSLLFFSPWYHIMLILIKIEMSNIYCFIFNIFWWKSVSHQAQPWVE